MKPIKVYLGESEVRRFTSPLNRWDDVVEMLRTIFGPNYHPELRVQYVDEDGDRITVSSDLEWKEALQFFEKENSTIIRLYIKEGANPDRYFKDSPAPEVVELYNKNGEEKQSMDVTELSISVPKGLERLFPDGKILPYNLPSWLAAQNIIKVVSLPNHEAEVDINVDRLVVAVHDRGLLLLNEGKIAQGKEMFEICVSITPRAPLALYNLACAEALLGSSQDAIAHLRSAIDNGYENFAHMEKDSDLDSLRNLAEFQALFPHAAPVNTEPITEPMEAAPTIEAPVVKSDADAIVDTFDIMEGDVQPSVPETSAPVEFGAELDQMAEMGFRDREQNLQLLRRTNGSMVDAIQLLLGM
eukprot:TRINITY_DN19258_c0_g1_i1.p1 TRINITY_DN19258_c0_g1~~TRINITY_DN19258_c0_g1_i1.p1  ORF type:complete len:357 (-),score=109.04 TRINITY_DN19258_c0_g1_i1:134-1204(-)